MIDHTLKNAENKMQKTVDGFQKELATIRTGYATPAIIEHVKVDYAGVPTPLNHIAGISAPAADLLVVQPWDKGSLQTIEKAILTSDLGLTPISDGNIIRINIPPLSEERRQELIKLVHKRLEERRIAIRNLRHEGMNELKELERNREISQDEHKRASNQLQQITDHLITGAEKVAEGKEKELSNI